MKKILLSILAFGAFMLTAQAQTTDVKNESKDVRFGVKAGLNVSTFTNFTDISMKPGFHVGAVAEIFINKKLSIQPELIYSKQGFEYSGFNVGSYVPVYTEYTWRQDYINVPIMVKYYIVKGFNVQGGMQFGFLVNSEMEQRGIELDTKSLVNSFDFGLNFGVGYELPIGVFFDMRYNMGLTNVFNKDFDAFYKYTSGNYSEDVKSENSVFQLSVGYKF